MATAMTMDMAGFPVAPPRKWWRGKGARKDNQRYTNINKNCKQGQGLIRKRTRSSFSIPRSVPRAPYNDSSFLMQVREDVSFDDDSSYKLNHEDYGYGSMTGLIRLRAEEDSDESVVGDDAEFSSVLTAAEVVEQRLDRGISRFEMIFLPAVGQQDNEARVTRQESHVQHLEDENSLLKDKLLLAQQELTELKKRLREDENIEMSDDSESC